MAMFDELKAEISAASLPLLLVCMSHPCPAVLTSLSQPLPAAAAAFHVQHIEI